MSSDYDKWANIIMNSPSRRIPHANPRADILAAIPDNWLDPLLTGPTAVIRDPITPKQIEGLLNRIRENVSTVLDKHGFKAPVSKPRKRPAGRTGCVSE
jgi:hypothetical protein